MGLEKLSDLVTNSDYSHNLHNMTKVTKSLSATTLYSTKRNRTNYTEQMARNRAGYLAHKLDNPSRMLFYLKCAWNLTDSYLDRLLNIALTKERPALYFSKAASREMAKNR